MKDTRLKDIFAQKSVLTLNVLWTLVAIVVFVIAKVCQFVVSAHVLIHVLAKVRRRQLLTRKRLSDRTEDLINGYRKETKGKEERIQRKRIYPGYVQQYYRNNYRLEWKCSFLGIFWRTWFPWSKEVYTICCTDS